MIQGPKYIGNRSTTEIVGWNKHVYNYYLPFSEILRCEQFYMYSNRDLAHVLDKVELWLGFDTSYRFLICSLQANCDRKTGKNGVCNINAVNICENL